MKVHGYVEKYPSENDYHLYLFWDDYIACITY